MGTDMPQEQQENDEQSNNQQLSGGPENMPNNGGNEPRVQNLQQNFHTQNGQEGLDACAVPSPSEALPAAEDGSQSPASYQDGANAAAQQHIAPPKPDIPAQAVEAAHAAQAARQEEQNIAASQDNDKAAQPAEAAQPAPQAAAPSADDKRSSQENAQSSSQKEPETARKKPEVDLLGQEIAGCIILEKISEGGMGTVFKGKHKALDRIVCVKILSPALANDKKAVGLFLTEARAIAELDHPNIVFVYNVGRERGFYFIVMSFIDGESLSSIVRKRPHLPISFVVETFIGILSGLEAAHQKGIIHRDIKPSNILITKKLEAKIVDFGIAKKVDKEKGFTKTTELAGTAYFLSPEQALGRPIDTRADLYSLGASLFYVLTGKYPFTGKTSMEIIQKHINEPVPDVSAYRKNIPLWLSQAVAKLMSKNPALRFQTAGETLTYFKKMRAEEQLKVRQGLNIAEEVGLQINTDKPASAQSPSPARYAPLFSGNLRQKQSYKAELPMVDFGPQKPVQGIPVAALAAKGAELQAAPKNQPAQQSSSAAKPADAKPKKAPPIPLLKRPKGSILKTIFGGSKAAKTPVAEGQSMPEFKAPLSKHPDPNAAFKRSRTKFITQSMVMFALACVMMMLAPAIFIKLGILCSHFPGVDSMPWLVALFEPWISAQSFLPGQMMLAAIAFAFILFVSSMFLFDMIRCVVPSVLFVAFISYIAGFYGWIEGSGSIVSFTARGYMPVYAVLLGALAIKLDEDDTLSIFYRVGAALLMLFAFFAINNFARAEVFISGEVTSALYKSAMGLVLFSIFLPFLRGGGFLFRFLLTIAFALACAAIWVYQASGTYYQTIDQVYAASQIRAQERMEEEQKKTEEENARKEELKNPGMKKKTKAGDYAREQALKRRELAIQAAIEANKPPISSLEEYKEDFINKVSVYALDYNRSDIENMVWAYAFKAPFLEFKYTYKEQAVMKFLIWALSIYGLLFFAVAILEMREERWNLI